MSKCSSFKLSHRCYTISCLFSAFFVFSALMSSYIAGVENTTPEQLTPGELEGQLDISQGTIPSEVIDALAMEGTANPGYTNLSRKDTPFGTYKVWDYHRPYKQKILTYNPEYSAGEPYITHMTGFRRGTMFGPDLIGRIFRENHITYNDGLGDGLLESLMIEKKYGLKHFFYGPDADYAPPILEKEYADFRQKVAEECRYMADWLQRLSRLYGQQFINQPDMLYSLLVYYGHDGFNFFAKRLQQDYSGINEEFKAEHGYDLPLMVTPDKPVEYARRRALWRYIHRKYGELGVIKSEEYRKGFVGQGKITGNIHFSSQVDYELWGKIFDYPGISARAHMIEHPLGWEYFYGYVTRLIADLTDKPPLVAPRVNLLGMGARIIPTPAAQKYWYAQVAQNGGRGFMEWVWDYPADYNNPHAYTGQNVGNPDQSTLPKLRWETMLYATKILCETNRFIPPKAETAILISLDSCTMEKWRRIFSAYIELVKADVWHQFISDQEIREGTENLSSFRVVYIPFMDYEHTKVINEIERFVRSGGTVISSDPAIFSYNECGEPMDRVRERIFGIKKIALRDEISGTIRVSSASDSYTINNYSENYSIAVDSNVDVLGSYENGDPAIVKKKVGNGIAIYFGSSVMDIYNLQPDIKIPGRLRFYKDIEQNHHIEDRSWIWDLTIEDIGEITGRVQLKYPPVDSSIVFRSFMYGHGEPTSWPWVYTQD